MTDLTQLIRHLERIEQRQTDLYRSLEQTYWQLEALFSVFALLPIRAPLPPMRAWAISPDFARVLLTVILTSHPTAIVELGGGVSSLIGGYALEKLGAGRLTTLEHLRPFADQVRRNLDLHQLNTRVQVIDAPLTSIEYRGETWTWYDPTALADLHSIDLLVVDGPAQQDNPQRYVRYPAMPYLFERLRPGGLILLDDADRADEQHLITRWLAEFPLDRVETYPTEKGAALLRKRHVE
ncbi:MAG: class I SAM-dependent methyltransferase [Anaerolineae bacterium]|jgi:predicted O-methyltransferase YrrM|nr:class I SAM-dependent methyltransferase [Anaerolineae bacterium]